MSALDYDLRIEIANNIARTEIRERRHGDVAAADRAHNRLCDVIESAEYPNIALRDTIKRLGRHNALAVGIDRDVVLRALPLRSA